MVPTRQTGGSEPRVPLMTCARVNQLRRRRWQPEGGGCLNRDRRHVDRSRVTVVVRMVRQQVQVIQIIWSLCREMLVCVMLTGDRKRIGGCGERSESLRRRQTAVRRRRRVLWWCRQERLRSVQVVHVTSMRWRRQMMRRRSTRTARAETEMGSRARTVTPHRIGMMVVMVAHWNCHRYHIVNHHCRLMGVGVS